MQSRKRGVPALRQQGKQDPPTSLRTSGHLHRFPARKGAPALRRGVIQPGFNAAMI